MMKKIQLEICCGTTCYMLGGSALLNLESQLPDPLKSQVEISAIPCSDECNRAGSLGQAPFVKIDGELISNASVESVIDLIARKIDVTGTGATETGTTETGVEGSEGAANE